MLLQKIDSIILPPLPAFSGRKFGTKEFYLWDNFKTHFFDKKEKKSMGGTIKLSTLQKNSFDTEILAELGNDAEVTLAELYEFLKTADKSIWYVAYIQDGGGGLWAVYCVWSSGNQLWHVEAYPITHPYKWNAGYRVFSRDSSESLSSGSADTQTLTPFDPTTLEVVINGVTFVPKENHV